MHLLNDAEVAHKLMPVLWGEHYTDPTFAIPQRWIAELRAGNYLGRPLGGEQTIPDVDGATFQEFSTGKIVVYRNGQTSLTG